MTKDEAAKLLANFAKFNLHHGLHGWIDNYQKDELLEAIEVIENDSK